MRENLEVIIQARIESLLGKEKIEQELAETAQRVSSIGKETAGNVQQNWTDPKFGEGILSKDDFKDFEKSQKMLDAHSREMDTKAQELMQRFLKEKDIIGIDSEAEIKKWQKQFLKLGERTGSEYDNLLEIIEREKYGKEGDEREYYELFEKSVKDARDTVVESYDDMARAVGRWREELKAADHQQRDFFQQLQQAGYVALGGMVVQKGAEWAITGQKLEARERTAFDLTSPLQSFTEKQLFELEKEQRERSLLYSTIGMVAGGALGAFGGAPGAIVGAGFGSQIGSQVAEYLNIEEQGLTEEEIKYTQQTYQKAVEAVQKYEQQKTEAKRLGLRYNANEELFLGSSDLGFTKEQELQYKELFAEMSRRFELDLYEQQLEFSRATGMKPEEVMRLNEYSRITNYDYNLTNLEAVRRHSKEIFGEDASSQRVIDVLEAIKEVNFKMLDVSTQAKAEEAMRFAALPEALFGIDSAFGRLGDYGDKTLSYFESLGQASSEAHESFLARAYLRGTDQLTGPEGLLARVEGGLFYKDNMQLFLQELEARYGGSKETAELALRGMFEGKKVPAEFIDRLAKLAAGEGIEVVTGYQKDEAGNYIDEKGNIVKSREDAAPIYRQVSNLAEFQEWTKQIQEQLAGKGLSGEEVKQQYEAMFYGEVRGKVISEFEDTAEELSRVHKEIAESWKNSILESQRRMAEVELTWLTSARMQHEVIGRIFTGFDLMFAKLEGKEIFKTEEDAKKAFHNKLYKAVYDATGYTVSDVLTDEEIVDLKTKGIPILGEYTRQAARQKIFDNKSLNPKQIEAGNLNLTDAEEEIQRLINKINATQEEIQNRKTEAIDEIKLRNYFNQQSVELEKKLYEESRGPNRDLGVDWRENTLNKLNKFFEEEGIDYEVKEYHGFRTKEENERLVKAGKASPNSRHLQGLAIDLQFFKDGKPVDNEAAYMDEELRKALKKFGEKESDYKLGVNFENAEQEINHMEIKNPEPYIEKYPNNLPPDIPEEEIPKLMIDQEEKNKELEKAKKEYEKEILENHQEQSDNENTGTLDEARERTKSNQRSLERAIEAGLKLDPLSQRMDYRSIESEYSLAVSLGLIKRPVFDLEDEPNIQTGSKVTTESDDEGLNSVATTDQIYEGFLRALQDTGSDKQPIVHLHFNNFDDDTRSRIENSRIIPS